MTIEDQYIRSQHQIQNREVLHDRQILLDNGWIIKIGRGFDIYQKPDNWFSLGSADFSLRPCLETTMDIYKK